MATAPMARMDQLDKVEKEVGARHIHQLSYEGHVLV